MKDIGAVWKLGCAVHRHRGRHNFIGSSAAKLFQIALPDQRIPPLLLTIGDLQGSNNIRHPDLATFLFECMKDNWYRVLQYPLLLDGIAGPLIYLPFKKNEEE
jgi:hypothetical protein